MSGVDLDGDVHAQLQALQGRQVRYVDEGEVETGTFHPGLFGMVEDRAVPYRLELEGTITGAVLYTLAAGTSRLVLRVGPMEGAKCDLVG